MNKIETFGEYQKLASRTCAKLETPRLDSTHMMLGVVTEIGEVLDIYKKNIAYGKEMDKVNLGEELADIAWYIANDCTFNGIDLDHEACIEGRLEIREALQKGEFYGEQVNEQEKTLSLIVNILLGYLGQDNTGGLFSDPLAVMTILEHVAEKESLDFFQCLTNNIAKLKVRYPEKFTNEDALVRNVEAERIELEK
jgi:NTP pyrophosphatase (non-canonical NTP hydrolase)